MKETAHNEMGRRRHNRDLYEVASSEETGNERLIDDSEGCETSKEDAIDGPPSMTPQQQLPSAPIASESEAGSVLSSPGGRPTPVNFDFHRPDAKRDPHIVQVCLKLLKSQLKACVTMQRGSKGFCAFCLVVSNRVLWLRPCV